MKKTKCFALCLIATSILTACGSDKDPSSTSETPKVVANTAPSVNAGADLIVDENQSISFTGTAEDSTGTIVSYAWQQTSGIDLELSGLDTSTLSFTAPEVDEEQVVVFELVATDDGGLTASDSISITIKNVLVEPTLSLNERVTVEENTEVEITSIVEDSNGSIVSYAWQQTDGIIIEIDNLTNDSLKFIAPEVDFDTTLTFDLTVTDNDGQTATSSVFVDVTNVAASVMSIPGGSENIVIDGQTVEAALNEVLVHLNDDVTEAELEAVFDEISNNDAGIASFDDALKVLQIRVREGASENSLITKIGEMGGVRHAGLNTVIESKNLSLISNYNHVIKNKNTVIQYIAEESTDEPLFSGDYWVKAVAADKAWDALQERTLAPVTLGVVDTGIGAGQISIESSRLTRLRAQENGQFGVVEGDDTETDSFHGLWVSSFIAGHNTSEGSAVYGVDHSANLIHTDIYVKRCKDGSTTEECSSESPIKTYITDLIAGTKATIDSGASIVNISWGDTSTCADDSQVRLKSNRNWRLQQTNLVEYAKEKDVLLVYSAGNNCEKNDDQLLVDINDIAQDAWQTNTLIVAATDADDKETDFTRMGNVVNIAAPGDQMGWGNTDGSLGVGTSFSAALVTGSAGIVKGINSSLKAAEIKDILVATSSNLTLSEESKALGTTGPTQLLNIHSAIQTADLTVDSVLEVKAPIALSKGDKTTSQLSFTLPETTVTAIDVMFLIDVSGSYTDDIASLKEQADNILENLSGRGINVAFGVSAFSDFPIDGYGHEYDGDEAFYLLQSVTTDIDAAKTGINNLTIYSGNDYQESQLEGLYQAVTGAGRDIDNDGNYTSLGDIEPMNIGWREGALKVILLATDAPFHDSDIDENYPGAGKTEVINVLQEKGVTVFGLQSGSIGLATDDLDSIVLATKGQTFLLSYDSNEIAAAISSALDEALKEIDLSIEVISGEQWVETITPVLIENVKPNEEVTFEINLKGIKNASLEELNYEVILWIRGDGSAVVRRVVIPITVPTLAD